MSKKLEVATKVLKEAEVKAAQIRGLETDPSYLPEGDLKSLQTELRRKVRAASRIEDQISDILASPDYLSDKDFKVMKEEAESVVYNCSNCCQSRPASQVRRCQSSHVCCPSCYVDNSTCPWCRTGRKY